MKLRSAMTVAVLALSVTACKGDKTTPCGSQVCRSGFVCDEIHEACVIPAQLTECEGDPDGSECIINGSDGFVCDQGVCLQSECGDGILDVHTGEECDDGNNINDDACPNSCTLNCGNGTADTGEECDGSDLNGETCTTQGFDSGQLECNNDCTLDLGQCTVECGNGVVHSSEACDDGNIFDGDGCSANCSVENHYECTGEPSVCTVIPYTELFAGGAHVCAHRADDTYWCWGGNTNGQLGDGGTTNQTTPVQLTVQSDIASLTLGLGHTCALLDDSTVWCWGSNSDGQLGDGNQTGATVPNPTPAQVVGLTGATAITAGAAWTCALFGDTTMSCWGWNNQGQVGSGYPTTPILAPAPVPGLTDITAIRGGGGHTCALFGDTTMSCWGWNSFAQLGIGTTTNPITTPTAVSGLSSVDSFALGGGHSCAVLTNGTVRCWGANDYGQLGDGTTVHPRTTPVQVPGINNAVSVVTGGWHSCALTSSGAVMCWGRNNRGALGDGTLVDSNTPLPVSGLVDVSQIATLGEYTCALRTDGSAWCWGWNDYGQLGNGSTVESNVPVPVSLPQ